MKKAYLIFIILLLNACNKTNDLQQILSFTNIDIENKPTEALSKLDSVKKENKFSQSDELQWNLLYIRAYEEKNFQYPTILSF